MKKHIFNAGPSLLADEVYASAAKAIMDFNDSGISILSISHRTPDFDAVMNEADALFRELLHIPDNYKIIYLGGGASTYFYEIPANFLGKKAAYINTGVWSKKAIKEAKRYGEVEVIATSEDKNFNYIPKGFTIPADADYLHITSNNTIYGTEFHEDLDSPIPVIADMSSNILSRPIDVTKYAMIYGGAQKNLAPAGVAFAIIREDMVERVVRDLPTMMQFKTHMENNSMFNTPPVFPIFVLKETLKWLKSIGGVEEIYRRNQEKAALLYDEIDRNPLFRGTVEKDSRSLMNICFVMAEGYEELAAEFMAYTKEQGIVGIKGHRLVGGFRASCYNALPKESVEVLVKCMQDFAAKYAK
ncbi:MAG: 3-phosphoserine/phosphohydroxythreonine transaminase [Alistipes sp.]|nr:3-phosphoserine/phosphohydroxythreonine transaminase [Rikenellaceae bacterium]MBO5187956.1 3-phosphoserine/phosphohydroxythreonine transaminase [Alistipes sp.]MBQ3083203.1 3-phosphoserine/phosphohydroxythreonine transaminase [Alistipes sp.]MBQ8471738.1 3-phosphoserine/phosphohydroxythreonine transaminase [Alistipes sp.]